MAPRHCHTLYAPSLAYHPVILVSEVDATLSTFSGGAIARSSCGPESVAQLGHRTSPSDHGSSNSWPGPQARITPGRARRSTPSRRERDAMTSLTSGTSVGIDVAKAELVIAARPGGDHWTESNDPAGIQALIARLKPLRPTVIVLEATGGY